MADTRLDDAIETVAHRLILHAADRHGDLSDQRAGFPDIGEDDWVRVVERAHQIIWGETQRGGGFQAAYEYLAGRAEGES